MNRDKESKGGAGSSRLRSWRNGIIVIFASCHAVKLLAGILPEVSRPDLLPFGLAHAYESLTGSRQNWNMFSTIPSHHRYAARIVIKGTDGQERSVGPVLPGFQEWPVPEDVRLFNFFERMLSGDMGDEVRDAYLHRVDEQLQAEERIHEGEKWSLEVTEDFTRTLAYIQRDGRMFERRIQRFATEPQNSSSPARP